MATCGIYSIVHLLSGRRYIGQSIRIEQRFTVHRSALRRGAHHCPRMQRAFDRDGEDTFAFVVIEECPRDALTKREQFWMDTHAAGGLYNLSTAAVAPRGYVRSAEHCAKLSAAHKGKVYSGTFRKGYRQPPEVVEAIAAKKRGVRLSPEHRAKISAGNKGRKLSPEHVAKIVKIHTGKVVSLASRAKMAAAKRGTSASAETRQRMREGQARAADLKRQKALEQWNRPGFREAISAQRRAAAASKRSAA